ncbi:DNA-binding protein EMBP-1-like [Iris pallida]|uniref:DNA-binding protein EMBP-1-like n=1 Tax=Iris pallida TaxID=29817 RepID=A0AAX6FJ31_IRIPA|nr:DNA-binding protein EMBP-1-like [Iris pallida]
MGSAEDATAPKPPKSATAAAAPPTEPAAASLPTTPPPYSTEWAAAVQAYYSGAAPPPPAAFFSPPPVWGSQHMMTPYGTPIPYSPMYHHPVYAHPSTMPSVAYPAVESGSNKSKGGGGSWKSEGGGGGKVTSGSADDYGSHSGGESGSEGTSGTGDDSAPQDISRKRSFGNTFGEGENAQLNTGAQNNGTTAESSYSGRARTVSKLPVSAPGRAAFPGPPTNLNIGMDIWNASHVGTGAVKGRPNAMASAAVGANGVMPEHQWQDERELKRERRKQSNRESARRSRLRKQQECEDLARKVTELNSENSALKVELEQLNKVCKDLEKENISIMGELSRMSKTGITEVEGIDCNSVSKASSVGGEGSGHAPQNPVG